MENFNQASDVANKGSELNLCSLSDTCKQLSKDFQEHGPELAKFIEEAPIGTKFAAGVTAAGLTAIALETSPITLGLGIGAAVGGGAWVAFDSAKRGLEYALPKVFAPEKK